MLDGWFVLLFEFCATILISMFETAAVLNHHADTKQNSSEFGTAVARYLEQT